MALRHPSGPTHEQQLHGPLREPVHDLIGRRLKKHYRERSNNNRFRTASASFCRRWTAANGMPHRDASTEMSDVRPVSSDEERPRKAPRRELAEVDRAQFRAICLPPYQSCGPSPCHLPLTPTMPTIWCRKH